MVQEVLLMILEPVFEPRFSSKSHAFRPGRNPHTVIRTIRSNVAGYLWFIRGDLSEIFSNVNPNVVLGCVGESVKDKKVLSLIKSGMRETRKKILNDDEPKPDPYWLRAFYDFSPEEAAEVPSYGYCGIFSPLLMNVCLNELDYMMENKIVVFLKPSETDSIWKQQGQTDQASTIGEKGQKTGESIKGCNQAVKEGTTGFQKKDM
ncbi:hypothetical protein SASPL_156542 [Salvia splendens]|uniref:Reverse transcriptase domain-containing protein n=1 Tax=Salvia splendens TaxID=180675 RepID=A0A8X8VWN3_SALSN|nr:hypothetical protein SASPL_156542 [Salvia splendens]